MSSGADQLELLYHDGHIYPRAVAAETSQLDMGKRAGSGRECAIGLSVIDDQSRFHQHRKQQWKNAPL